jgi:Fe-S-cluster containining protein
MSRWYDGGLRFECTQCGHCCTGKPGYVWISPEEERAIAARLGLREAAFRRKYTRLVGGNLSLVERAHGECVFLLPDRRCAIHDVKPRQCITFPFWPRLLESPETWAETAARCPGIGQGPLFDRKALDLVTDRDTPRATICETFANRRG